MKLQKSQLEADLALAKNNLKKKLGKLYYLESLQQAGYGKRGASNFELRPICQVPLGNKVIHLFRKSKNRLYVRLKNLQSERDRKLS